MMNTNQNQVKDGNSKNVGGRKEIGAPYMIYDPKERPMNIQMPFLDMDARIKKNYLIVEKIKNLALKMYSRRFRRQYEKEKKKFILRMLCAFVVFASMIGVLYYILIYQGQSNRKQIIVDGEFQVLNVPFNYEMSDKNSPAFATFSSGILRELDNLFGKSDVTQYYMGSEILEINPDMTVKSISYFVNSDYVNVGRIGLAFLRSLILQRGHPLLGAYSINIQSIGFQIRGEEGEWGEWSEWEGCKKPTDYVATRTRKCYTKDTHRPTDVERCLLIPGNKGDLDIKSCAYSKQFIDKNQTNTDN